MPSFDLLYGSSRIRFSIADSNFLGRIEAAAMPALADPAAEIKKALRAPIESSPLSEIVVPGERIGIVVSDKTRVSKSDVFVPVIIEELFEAGVSAKDIFVIFANGTHPLHTKEEREAIVGREMASKITLIDHDCRDSLNLVNVGTTSHGTQVEINRRLFEADRIILTGVITYHYFAGFGGGRKSILPGVASFETIQANHKLIVNPGFGTGMNEMAKTGMLYGNPIHEDMEEAALMVGPDFLLNVILDEKREIARVFAGDWVLAHGEGCDFLDRYYQVTIDQLADAVIVACGGHPKDINFVQSHKAMDNAAYALKEGGTMVLVAEAAGGFPSPVYEEWVNLGSLEAIEEGLRRNFSIPGHTVYAAMEKANRYNIIWVSQQDPHKVQKIGITPVASIKEALALVQRRLGTDWKTYVIPDGYVTFPHLSFDAEHPA